MNVILGRVEDANPDLEFPDVQLRIWSSRLQRARNDSHGSLKFPLHTAERSFESGTPHPPGNCYGITEDANHGT